MLRPSGPVTKPLTPAEDFMLANVFNPWNFGSLMVAPRIGKEMHQQAIQCMFSHYDDLRDGFLSLYGSFTTIVTGAAAPGYNYESNVRQGTRALTKFSTAKPPRVYSDFVPWMWLGTSILLHAHCVLGSNNAPVRRFMLSHLREMGEAGEKLSLHPVIVSLIALDINDSLMQRQMPILNMPAQFADPLRQELFLGLSPGIFRLLYRLCELSCRAAVSIQNVDLSDTDLDARLVDLVRRVDSWHPDISTDVLQKLSAVEATHVQTQVRVHKTCIKLFVHRLQHPFGQEDYSAQNLAGSIFSDLDLATSIASSPPTLVTLPFTIAAIEALPDDRDKVRTDIARYIDGISPKVDDTTNAFLVAIWQRRDLAPGFKWMNVLDELPEFCINRVGAGRKVAASSISTAV
ncbi:Putative fungal transcription factor [Septoria linicola]|uniref:Fungal transcription factor n=1 Tax=Septoria linicola TaxID=215465 RepID=A0A9Q9ARQ1_9PEZI|nr:Putative fungal transcription factor [Septoria linicola]